MKNYRFWLWSAATLLLLTAAIHSLSFFSTPVPADETERTLIDLMTNYRQNAMGMMVSTRNIMTALSACFSLVCLLGGLVLVFLLRKNADQALFRGIILIYTLVYGILFAVMAALTFPPPIVLTGLIFVSILGALLTSFKRPPWAGYPNPQALFQRY